VLVARRVKPILRRLLKEPRHMLRRSKKSLPSRKKNRLKNPPPRAKNSFPSSRKPTQRRGNSWKKSNRKPSNPLR